jgi:hypothetical protein
MNNNSRFFPAGAFILALLALYLCTGCAERGKPIPPGQEGAPFATLAEEALYGIDPGYKITDDSNPLSDTKWQVMTVTPKPEKAFSTMYMNFKSDGNLEEVTTFPDGSVKREVYVYNTAGATLAINKAKNVIIDARYKITGNRMIMDTGEYSMVLQRVK